MGSNRCSVIGCKHETDKAENKLDKDSHFQLLDAQLMIATEASPSLLGENGPRSSSACEKLVQPTLRGALSRPDYHTQYTHSIIE